MKRLYKINWLSVLLIFSLLLRLFRLSIPQRYIYDEVYHVVTVKAIAANNPDGYEWWHESPEPDTAYDWLHPPLAKLIQAVSQRRFWHDLHCRPLLFNLNFNQKEKHCSAGCYSFFSRWPSADHVPYCHE
jgi:hypothetical protein